MNQEKIGKTIKEIRQKNNLTQQEFAKQFKVSYQAVSKWETGKNIPDIAVLKQICDCYNLDINDLLEGKTSVKKTSKILNFKIISIILLGLILILAIFHFMPSNFEFKTLSSNCDDFRLNGSIAYNDAKSSIYISHIAYCGEKDDEVYQTVSCDFYEENNNSLVKIKSFEAQNNITLDEYLKGLTLHIDDYKTTCKNYTENSLILEINAVTKDEKNIFYKVPLKLEDNCDSLK